MKNTILKWSKENEYNLAFKFILFGISPFLAFIYSLKSLNTRSSYMVLFLTGIFFGMSFSIGYDQSIDASRHRVYFERDFFIGWNEYLNTVLNFFSFNSSTKDLFRDTVSFIVSRFTNNYHWYFLVIAVIYGYFSLKSLRYLTSYKHYAFSISFLLITFIFLKNNIFHINGVRFWTAGWIATYAIFQIFVSNNKRYFLLLALTPLVHISYVVVFALAALSVVYQNTLSLKNNDKPLYMIYFFSVFFSFFSISLLQGLTDYLPPVLNRLVQAYTDSEYVSEINDFDRTLTGMYFNIAKQAYINFMLILIIKSRHLVVNNFKTKSVFNFVIILMCFVNAFMFVPSLGGRFFLFSFPLISFIWAVTFKGKRYNTVLYLIPLVFLRDIYVSFNHFSEVLVLSDLYASPVFLIYKYLINYSL